MTAPRHQTSGGKASDGAGLLARSYSGHERAGETLQSIRAAARELLVALAVSMGVAVSVAAVVVGYHVWVVLL